MRVILVFLAFIIWMLVSLALVLSVIGLFFFIIFEDEWIEIGKELASTFKSK